MNNEIIIPLIIGQSILVGLPLVIFISFYHKIKIRDTYKKIIIASLFFFQFLGILGIIIYSNAVKNNVSIVGEFFPNGDYSNLVFGIFPLAIVGFIIFHLLRASLGKIDINIYGNNFTSGDKINGDLNIQLKDNIKKGNLYVYLRGYRTQQSSTSNNSSLQKVFEDKITLVNNDYFENGIKNYNFSFEVPYLKSYIEEDIIEKYRNEGLIDEKIQMVIDSAKLMKNFIGGNNNGKESIKFWRIEVRLEKDGIDLFNQTKINLTRTIKN